MKKTVSIIMAIIILFSVSVNAELFTVSAKTPATITASIKAKAHKKKKHKHNMPKGNMGKWFKSRKALKKYVAKEMKYWSDLEESGQITREEYYRKCPCGYEAWSCSCGKWTGNFKYD